MRHFDDMNRYEVHHINQKMKIYLTMSLHSVQETSEMER